MSSAFTDQIPPVVTQYASAIARIFKHKKIGPDHVLLALSFRAYDEGDESCAIIPESCQEEIEEYYGALYPASWNSTTITEESREKELLPFENHQFPAAGLLRILILEGSKFKSCLEDAIAIALSLHENDRIAELLETINMSVRELAENFLISIGKVDFLDHGIWLATCLSDIGLATSEMGLLAAQTHKAGRESKADAIQRYISQNLGLVGMIHAFSVTGEPIPEGSPPPKICLLTALALGLAFYNEFMNDQLDPKLRRFYPSKSWQKVLPLLKELLRLS